MSSFWSNVFMQFCAIACGWNVHSYLQRRRLVYVLCAAVLFALTIKYAVKNGFDSVDFQLVDKRGIET
jgi:hypothetical protein